VNILEIIDKKRLGQSHSQEELAFLVDGAMTGSIPDYQLSAWLMAVCCRGLNLDETTWLTDLYVKSGQVLDFSDIGGVVVDKHSTGGVGDKTTLILAPLLAACGLKVAKLSGRGLGFTGGTIDKLEAIPGFQTQLTAEQFRQQVKDIGIALGSQSQDLAPADGKIYALRDVTATVASIPLIAASVVSKKIAAGAQVIVLDIKVGSGAFMKSLEEARQLAETCREVGKRLGRSISTVISHMDQPLGNAIGHTIEVMEAIDTLKGKGPPDLTELCLTLGAMATKNDLAKLMASGEALNRFRQLIQAQHGNPDILDNYSLMPQPTQKIPVLAKSSGFVHQCNALKLAMAAKVLGAGRVAKGDVIDLAVGVKLFKKLGDPVQAGEALGELWANAKGQEEARQLFQEAYVIDPEKISPSKLIEEICAATQLP